ncbi:MAG TPA: dihydrofolate reductase [Blastocatellia bacterium]|nr:dihydrofolate reductase [Blastocatellia bacterium]
MIISIIVAMDEKGGIGRDNRLPWRLSADLKKFKELTMGHHIILGRKTFESIGRPLPGRHSVIVTHQPGYIAEGCFVVHSLDDALRFAREQGENESFICGGAEIYAQALGRTDRIYLTRVHAVVGADTFFPEWDESEWQVEESYHHPADEKNEHSFTFKLLTRSKPLSR